MNAKKTSAFPLSAGINEKVSPVKVGLESLLAWLCSEREEKPPELGEEAMQG